MTEAIIRKYHADLVELLPMNDAKFRAKLYSAGLFHGNLWDEVQSKPTAADKAEHFLLHGMKNDTNCFSKLLAIMEGYSDHLKKLAEMIYGESDLQHSLVKKRKIFTMLGEVQNKLKTVYKHVCYSDNPHYYIQLALVREEIRNIRDQRLNEITRHTLQGQVDEILKIKEPLKRGLEDIFHHKDLPCPVPRLILILGAPGIGKTTLANEICLKWASDEECFLSNDYDLVILIRLRTIQEKTLQQAMIETVGSEAAYDELLTKSDGNRCLIILEGLDEISAYWQNNDTMFNGLVKNTVFLSRASILVTSRPHACVYLYMEIKPYVRSIEIVGFNKPQIKECAEQYFKNSVTAEKFMNQMSNNPRISSLCYVPLCLNMVLECFKYNNETLHTTLTELYQLFIISKVDEHIHFKKVLPLGTVLESDQTYFNNLATVLSNVPSVLSTRALETMFLLSKLAYKSYFQWSDQFINPKIIYTIADLAQCNITNLESDACGLLKATNTLFAIGNTAVYTFNHLSVQEYFCALYISLLPEDQQLQLLKDHITHYPDMWPFFAGITKLRSSDVIDHLCTFLLQDKRLEETILIYSDMAVYNVGKNLVVTTALSSFYEAQLTSDVCIHQLVSLFISRHSLSPHNYLSIFYLMSIAPITCLHLRGCNIGDQEVEELMARCRDLIPSLKVMDLSVNNITHNGIENVVTIMKSTTNLRHFSASRNPIRDAVIYLFSLQHLVQLNVSLIGMTEVGTRVLGEDFKSNSSLQSLEISKNDIKDSELTRILNNLPITLVRLAISSCNLTYNGAVSIGKMLRINQTLKHLEISTNSIGDDGISAISDSLHVNTTLIQIVACSCGFYSKGAESVANMLQVNKTLKYLDVSKNQIGDDGTTAVALSILTNATLVQLNISSCDFCKRGAEVIAEVLRVNKTLKCLDISENFIEYDELSTLACSIQANTTLIKLKISDTHYKFKFTNETLKLVNEVHHSGNTMFSNERKHWLGVTCSGGEVDFEEWFIYGSDHNPERSYCIKYK